MPHPFVDMFSEIGPELGARSSITVVRAGGGAWNSANGRYEGVTTSQTPTDAIVQPSGPTEIEKLPENERTKEAITVFTRFALLTSLVSTQNIADRILWGGKTYEVQVSEDWEAQAQYARAIATRVGV